eukprot:g418.t1
MASSKHEGNVKFLQENAEGQNLVDISRFGDGDGSYWDRWLNHEPPSTSSASAGFALPKSGYKRHRPKRYGVRDNSTRCLPSKHNDSEQRMSSEDPSISSGQSAGEKNAIDVKPMEGTELSLDSFNTEDARDKAAHFTRLVEASSARLLERVKMTK